ncbi:MAG TPA: outer membrane protein assembly factor BamE [Burkholderiales bacterium]|jgi:hypothetical protein
MRTLPILATRLLLLACCLIAGCAAYSGASLKPGISTEADARRVMGQPTAIHNAPPGAGYAQSLEYSRGPGGRQTYMARFDTSGRLLRIDQVLQLQTLAQVRVGVDDMDSIDALLGRPGREAGISRLYGGPTWDYYAEDGGRHTILSVTFDHDGLVAATGWMMDPDEMVIPGHGR